MITLKFFAKAFIILFFVALSPAIFMALGNALSKLRLSTLKLAGVAGKWCKTKKEDRVCKFCDLNEIDDETQFLLQCRN